MKLEERLARLEAQQEQAVAQVNALRGAIQVVKDLMKEAKEGTVEPKPKRRKAANGKK